MSTIDEKALKKAKMAFDNAFRKGACTHHCIDLTIEAYEAARTDSKDTNSEVSKHSSEQCIQIDSKGLDEEVIADIIIRGAAFIRENRSVSETSERIVNLLRPYLKT